VWVRRDLVDSRSFTEADCYPVCHGDQLKDPVRINLITSQWKGRSKPRLKQITDQVKMADWRGGRGRGRPLINSYFDMASKWIAPKKI
jgi:hypothetical protein